MSYVGERVMQALKKMDEVAYVRFASVYRSFRDIEEFVNEIKELYELKESKEQQTEHGQLDDPQIPQGVS